MMGRRTGRALATAVLAVCAGSCDPSPAAAPALPAEGAAPTAASAPAPRPAAEAPPAPPPAAPAEEQLERRHEVSVACGGTTLYGLAPRAWARDAAAGGECAARWTVTTEEGDRAWVLVHCLPAGRVGLPELDAWYGLFRGPDGSPLPEAGTGRAGIGSTCALRHVDVRAQGTLVSPIPCLPIAVPAPDLALHREVLETPGASFAFDLIGPPAALERPRSGVAAGVRWSSSIAADHTAFAASMRETSAPTATSPYTRPCP